MRQLDMRQQAAFLQQQSDTATSRGGWAFVVPHLNVHPIGQQFANKSPVLIILYLATGIPEGGHSMPTHSSYFQLQKPKRAVTMMKSSGSDPSLLNSR